MVLFIIGVFIFFAVHHIRQIAPSLRETLISRAGISAYKGVFSLVIFGSLALLVLGWIQFRADAPQVYDPPSWGRHATLSLVYVGLVLIISANMPIGFIKSFVRHPMSLGIIIWAGAHLFSNGDALSVTLFALFVVSSIWHIASATLRGDEVPQYVTWRGDIGAIVVAAIFYYVFAFWLHGPLIGVSPV